MNFRLWTDAEGMQELDVFYGELTPVRAVVYARLPRPAEETNLKLSGSIRGPRCLHAQTLPATWPLVDRGPGPTLLAGATVTEPCFWSPELPALYDVTVRLERGGQTLATERRELAFRPLGTRGRQLIMAGKNWVLRGVCTSSTTSRLPREWHDVAAALVTEQPDDELLSEASQWGALGIVFVEANGKSTADKLRRLGRYPGVAIAAFRGDMPLDFNKSTVAPNLLFAQSIDSDSRAAPWSDLWLLPADDLGRFRELARQAAKPVLAMRRLLSPLDLPSARAACDALQRDLAPHGQFAGYVV